MYCTCISVDYYCTVYLFNEAEIDYLKICRYIKTTHTHTHTHTRGGREGGREGGKGCHLP